MFILIIVPILLFAFGIFCEKKDNPSLFCIGAAIAVFAVCGLASFGGFVGADADRLPVIGTFINSISFDDLGTLDAPPAVVLIMKICVSFGAEPSFAVVILGIIQTLLTFFVLYTQCETPYSAAAVLTFCFLPVFFAGSSVFTAALICLCASEYIRERRFFRYAALILIAACFDMSALLLIPLYFVMIIPGAGISAAVSAVIAALLYLFPDVTRNIFLFLGGHGSAPENNSPNDGMWTTAEVPLAAAIITAVLAVICLLMYAMFRNRPGSYENLVPVFFLGACMTMLTALDSQIWSGVSLMLLMQSAVPLAGEFKEIGRKFLGIVFPKYKMTSRLIFDALCCVSLVGISAWLIFADIFGASAYETALKAGLGL